MLLLLFCVCVCVIFVVLFAFTGLGKQDLSNEMFALLVL